MRIFVVRHGQDLPTHPGRLTAEDTRLSNTGKQQALACAVKLQQTLNGIEQIQILASPKQRTIQTAQIITDFLGIDSQMLLTDTRLIERDCTRFIGEPAAEVFSHPEAELVRGGMEPYNNVYARLSSLYSEIARKSGVAILVTHSGNIRPLWQLSQDITPDPKADAPDLPMDSYLQLSPRHTSVL